MGDEDDETFDSYAAKIRSRLEINDPALQSPVIKPGMSTRAARDAAIRRLQARNGWDKFQEFADELGAASAGMEAFKAGIMSVEEVKSAFGPAADNPLRGVPVYFTGTEKPGQIVTGEYEDGPGIDVGVSETGKFEEPVVEIRVVWMQHGKIVRDFTRDDAVELMVNSIKLAGDTEAIRKEAATYLTMLTNRITDTLREVDDAED